MLTRYVIPVLTILTLTGCQKTQYITPKKRPDHPAINNEKSTTTQASLVKEPKPTTSRERKKLREEKAKKNAPLDKQLKEMNYAELKAAKNKAVADHDHLRIIACLKRALAICTDMHELKEIRLEIADFHFDDGNLEEASAHYEDFVNFYPGSELVEYAQYKAILCNYYAALDADRDQSKTNQTLRLAQQFLSQRSYHQFMPDVQAIFKLCRNQLFESEVSIFNYYLKRHKMTAAEQRLDQIKTQFAEHRFMPVVLSLEIQLAQHQGNTALLQEKQTALASIDPELASRAASGQVIDAHASIETVNAILAEHGLKTEILDSETKRKNYAGMF